MANLTITPIPDLSQVRLDLDLSDLPGITEAVVVRFHPDGTEHEVRPSPVPLSGGLAVLYDTEAPLDTVVYYRAYPTAVRFAGGLGVGGVLATTVRPAFADTFTRVVAPGGWGAPWVVAAGVAANFSVTGTHGQQAISTINAQRVAENTTTFGPWQNTYGSVQFFPPFQHTTGLTEFSVALRYGSLAGPQYQLTLRLKTSLRADLLITQTDGVTVNDIYEVDDITFFGITALNVRWVQIDQTLYVKVWNSPAVEPAAFQATANNNLGMTDKGGVALRSFLDAAYADPLPYNARFDNLSITTVDTYDTVELPSTIDGLSGGWLRDPLRPCNDLRLVFCPPETCPISSGIVLAAYGTETYAADAGRFAVRDRRRPVICYATRKDAVGTLQLVTVTCTDRDALLTLLEPGSPLLFQLPPEYCVPDRYLDIGDVDVSPLARDIRRAWRLFNLPWVSVDAPGGPAQGVCGTRWMDLCKNYATWDDIDGVYTIQEVLEGEATT